MKDKMAEVEEQPAAAANGNGAHTVDSEDEESAARPVDIEQDMREMDRRKRVEAIMSSKLFREELERVVSDSIKESGADGVTHLLSNMMNVKQSSGNTAISGAGISLGSVIPINDIRGLEGMSYSKNEKLLRCKLAAVYRLFDMYGWTQNIYNHISVRISQDTEHFLINPFGMLYNEITASGLVKVDMQGEVVETGTTNFGVNVAGFMLHAAIHSARPDLKCVVHVHMPNIVAVSSMKCGLLYLSQESCLIGDVSYHNYEGLVVEKAEWESLSRDLGVHNKVMLLRNHGAICCGETIEEAFYYAYHLVLACDTQLKMVPLGIDNLIMIDEPTRRKVYEMGQLGGGGVDSLAHDGPAGEGDKKKNKKWGVGEMEFEAMMRMMDNAGYRSGFVYKQPLVRDEPPKPKSDVELPAAVSSLGFLLEEQNLYKDGPLQALLGGFNKSYKEAGRTKWMNSPNVYQKIEVLETGTPDPKKITKWIQDGSPSKSTAIPIESPNQFVPLGTSKKEFRRLQTAMKEGRRAGGITAGPESKVLEGNDWEAPMQDGKTVVDHVDYKVGAASKGIIQRDFQHHATVFNSAYARNPFDNVSADELAEYRRIIDAKNRGPGDITEDESVAGGPNSTFEGDHTFNGEETDGNRTFSEGEGDTSKATDTEMASPRKEKKKKSGLRTPSFLKKKKKDKKKEK